jgi:hypothetical protein
MSKTDCDVCRKRFHPEGPDDHYCSHHCANKAHNKPCDCDKCSAAAGQSKYHWRDERHFSTLADDQLKARLARLRLLIRKPDTLYTEAERLSGPFTNSNIMEAIRLGEREQAKRRRRTKREEKFEAMCEQIDEAIQDTGELYKVFASLLELHKKIVIDEYKRGIDFCEIQK